MIGALTLRTPEVLSLAWQRYPVVWVLFGLVVAFLAGRVRHKTSKLGRVLYVVGLMSNAIAVAANNAMPVVQMPASGAASSLWKAADSTTHLRWLVDNASLYYFSIGDIILRCGGILIILSWFYHKSKQEEV